MDNGNKKVRKFPKIFFSLRKINDFFRKIFGEKSAKKFHCGNPSKMKKTGKNIFGFEKTGKNFARKTKNIFRNFPEFSFFQKTK